MAASRLQIIPAEISHVYALAATLRREDASEIDATGFGCRDGLRAIYRGALLRRTAMVDGEVAAMFGLTGDALSDSGEPWLLTSAAIERVPCAFLREARREVASMLRIKPVLHNYVMASYTRACRFVLLLGFTLGEPEPMGPKSIPFRKFEMRR